MTGVASDLLRRAAFGDRPDALLPVPPADPWQRWLAAVALGAQGHYAAGAALLSHLTRAGDPVLAAHAAGTLAAHRRQLGGHAAARRLDAAGLARLAASRRTDHAARAVRGEILLGLAADALGLGRVPEAQRLLAAARAAAPDPDWRPAIRLGWVSAEIALGSGCADVAVEHARAAARLADAGPSVRHRVKSGLVLGAALVTRGAGEEAGVLLNGVRDRAREYGLLPLVWPCALLLAELDPAAAATHRRAAAEVLRTVLGRTDPQGRRLAAASPWMPDLRLSSTG